MIKFIIKSLFVYLLLAIIFVFMYYVFYVITSEANMDITSMGAIVTILLNILCVWLFTKLQNKLAVSISFMYWVFCLGLAIFTYCTTLNSSTTLQTLFLHYAGLMFFVPELHGVLTTYLNTETTYLNGEVIGERSWESTSYTPGCLRKVILMAIVSVAFYLLELYVGVVAAHIIFAVELIYSLTFIGINVKNFFW